MVNQETRTPVVLAVDDEPLCLRTLRDTLLAAGYRVIPTSTAREVLSVLEEREPDLVILDIKLPESDGFELCRRIRTFSSVPVIMLTALFDEADKVRGFEAGADDYLTKPYSVAEFLARVRAALRRSESQQPGPLLPSSPAVPRRIIADQLVIDDVSKRVLRSGEETRLSPTEYRLLWELASNAGKLVTRTALIESVWGRLEGNVEDALKCAIRRLRQRIGDDPYSPHYVATRRGFGYVFVAPVTVETSEVPLAG
jgi:two-component system, OmpR family, KDP operon response regulator KdpE